jgi:hypothetical protein
MNHTYKVSLRAQERAECCDSSASTTANVAIITTAVLAGVKPVVCISTMLKCLQCLTSVSIAASCSYCTVAVPL